jgi:hypothetical protein
VIPEGSVSASAPSTAYSSQGRLVTTLWLAGRGVYRDANNGYGSCGRLRVGKDFCDVTHCRCSNGFSCANCQCLFLRNFLIENF